MLALSAADKEALMQTDKKNPDWGVRERAHSVLLLSQGKTCAQVAALQELSMRTVSNTRKRWNLVKHTWMAPKHRHAQTLENDVGEILDNVGTRYHMAFSV